MTTEQAMHAIDPNSVRKGVSVRAPLAVAWQVFTEQMGAWWPLAVYKIGKAKAVDAVIEPRVGGRWYERGEDEPPAIGAAYSRGSRPRAWCCPGISVPTGSLIRI